MSKKLLATAAMLMLMVWASTAHADFTAYSVPSGTGNQAWMGSLGLDFDVNSGIEVTAMGVFDSGQSGTLTTPISAEIFNVTTQSPVAGTLVTISGSSGTLIGGSLFQNLLTPVTLAPGDYSIVSWGYSATEPNGNWATGNPNLSTLDTGGGLISFVGSGQYSASAGTFPTNIDNGPANLYSAGTFEFEAADPPPVPLPSTVLLLGSGLLGLVALGWRKRRGF